MAESVLEVAGLSKRFCRDLRRSLAYGVADIAAELWPWRASHSELRRDEFWALDDISFTLARGEAMAVVGHNGAGKSTLLRIVAGLFKPDAGEVRLSGSVQSVIELGTGFNPLLSGRENAELELAWRRRSRRTVGAEVEAVNAFAELGPLFDAPLQSYSTGMRARLAFALAAQTPCDLLLLDEVLAVGDQDFQRKCLFHVRQHLDRGGALLFVSHNIFQIQAVCRHGLLLDRGRVAFQGSAVEAADRLFEVGATAQAGGSSLPPDPAIARIEQLVVVTSDGQTSRAGEPIELRLTFYMPVATMAGCSISLWTRDLSVCIAIVSDPIGAAFPPGISERTCMLPDVPLVEGHYVLRASTFDPETFHAIALHGFAGPGTPLTIDAPVDRFSILRRNMGQLVHMESRWH